MNCAIDKQPPEALVRGCNDPISIGVLSDWIEEQYGISLDLDRSGWDDGFGCNDGLGYEHSDIFGYGYGNGYGYGFSDGNGYGYSLEYGFGCNYSFSDGRGSGFQYGYGLGDGDGSGYDNYSNYYICQG